MLRLAISIVFMFGLSIANAQTSMPRCVDLKTSEKKICVQEQPDGSLYVGEMWNQLYEGQGTLRYSDGRIYAGTFKSGKRSGAGTILLPDGGRIAGMWLDDRLNGQAIELSRDGKLILLSFYRDGNRRKGTLYEEDGTIKKYDLDEEEKKLKDMCLLIVKGKKYIDGKCPLEGDGFSVTVGSNKEKSLPYWGMLLFDENRETATGYWNGSKGSTHAQTDLGTLKRDGACWKNKNAEICFDPSLIPEKKPNEKNNSATAPATDSSPLACDIKYRDMQVTKMPFLECFVTVDEAVISDVAIKDCRVVAYEKDKKIKKGSKIEIFASDCDIVTNYTIAANGKKWAFVAQPPQDTKSKSKSQASADENPLSCGFSQSSGNGGSVVCNVTANSFTIAGIELNRGNCPPPEQIKEMALKESDACMKKNAGATGRAAGACMSRQFIEGFMPEYRNKTYKFGDRIELYVSCPNLLEYKIMSADGRWWVWKTK